MKQNIHKNLLKCISEGMWRNTSKVAMTGEGKNWKADQGQHQMWMKLYASERLKLSSVLANFKVIANINQSRIFLDVSFRFHLESVVSKIQ